MIGTRGHVAGKLVSLFLGILVGVGLAQLGGRIQVGTDQQPEPNLAPDTYGGDVVRDSRQDVIAYARTLLFAEAIGAGDEQRLVAIADSVHGRAPLVRVEPAVGLMASGRELLANGLVLARFINRDTVPYPALGIGASDTTYWWADSVPSGRWRALYFSSDPAIPPVEVRLHLEQPAGGQGHGRPSSARWVVADEGERPRVTCGVSTVCLAGDPIGG